MTPQEFASGSGVNVTIPLIDQAGEAFAANAISFRLLDDKGDVILPWQPPQSFVAGSTEVVINIYGQYNTLPEGTPFSGRVIEIKAVTNSGVRLVTEVYVVVSGVPLAAGTNSFMTYTEAVLLGRTMAGVEAWMGESKSKQVSTLMHAFTNIGNLKLRTGKSKPITQLTATELFALPIDLLNAVRRAQLIEANYLLTVDTEAAAMREDGVVMMDVGESKQQWRATKPLTLHTCKAVYRALGQWIDHSVRIGRS